MNENSNIAMLLEKAWIKRGEEKYNESQQLVEEAYRICEADDYNSLGRVFHIYMQFESDTNNHEKALEYCRKSISYYKKAGNPDKIAHSTRHLADIQYQLGKLEASELNYRNAIEIYRDNDGTMKGDLANALRGYGLVLEKLGKNDEAIAVWIETKELYRSCNLQAGVVEASRRLDKLEESN